MAADGGFFTHVGETFSASAQYLRARMRLMGVESREALGHYLWIVIYLVAALVMLAFTYVFFVVSAVFLIQHLTDVHWGWVLLAAAGAHLVVVIVCALVAKAKFAQPMFQTTLAELKKDQKWLRRPTTKTL